MKTLIEKIAGSLTTLGVLGVLVIALTFIGGLVCGGLARVFTIGWNLTQ